MTNEEILKEALTEIRDSKFCSYENSGSGKYGIGVADGHRFCSQIARTALDAVKPIETTGTDDARIIAMMTEYGGGFVKALAKAYAFADPENRERIRNAFPEYWKMYSEMAVHRSNTKD